MTALGMASVWTVLCVVAMYRSAGVTFLLPDGNYDNGTTTTASSTTGLWRWTSSSWRDSDASGVVVGRRTNVTENDSATSEETVIGIHSFVYPDEGCLETKSRPHCALRDVIVDPSEIHSRAKAGAPLEAKIMGQAETDEFLSYASSSSSSGGGASFWATHTRQRRLSAMQTVLRRTDARLNQHLIQALASFRGSDTAAVDTTAWPKCHTTLHGTTLLVVRYEYVNLYHTMTDWWNAYWSSLGTRRTTNHSKGNDDDDEPPVHVLFLDAHPEGNLDSVWRTFFRSGTVRHVQNLPHTTCLEHVRFVPVGYMSPLTLGTMGNDYYRYQGGDDADDHYDPPRMRRFVDFVLDRYNLTRVRRIPNRIVVLDRVPYVAHARSDTSKTPRGLRNLAALARTLPDQVRMPSPHDDDNNNGSHHHHNNNISVHVHTMVHQSMREQIRVIREASVLIANHGAGLTHLLWLEEGAHVVELSCAGAHFFPALSRWKRPGVRHHCQPRVDSVISDTYWNKHVVSVVQKALT